MNPWTIVALGSLVVLLAGLPLVMRGHFATQQAHAERAEFNRVISESEPPTPATTTERALVAVVAVLMVAAAVYASTR